MRSISESWAYRQYLSIYFVGGVTCLVPCLGLFLEVGEDVGLIFLLRRLRLQLVEILLWFRHGVDGVFVKSQQVGW